MRENRGLIALGITGLLWLGGVVGIFIHVSHETPQAHLHLKPLPATVCPSPLLGVNSVLAYETNPRYRTAHIAAIHRILDPQVVRINLLWNQVEPVKGRRNWRMTDDVIKGLRAADIEPILDVIGSPPWANGVAGSKANHDLYVPRPGPAFDAWLRHYSDFVADAAKRYRGVGRRWEIWNEPNTASFWRPRPSPAQYLHLYDTLRATILRVEPHAQVAVGGIAHLTETPGSGIAGLKFLRELTASHPKLGAVAIHPYPSADHSPTVHLPGQDNFDDIARTHSQLVAERYRIPLWVTEWGWSSANVGKGRQARYVDASVKLLERRYRYVGLATYFTDRDQPPQYFQGLLDVNLRPKPAASKFLLHTTQLAARCRG